MGTLSTGQSGERKTVPILTRGWMEGGMSREQSTVNWLFIASLTSLVRSLTLLIQCLCCMPPRFRSFSVFDRFTKRSEGRESNKASLITEPQHLSPYFSSSKVTRWVTGRQKTLVDAYALKPCASLTVQSALSNIKLCYCSISKKTQNSCPVLFLLFWMDEHFSGRSLHHSKNKCDTMTADAQPSFVRAKSKPPLCFFAKDTASTPIQA